jgi:hypothetical protein
MDTKFDELIEKILPLVDEKNGIKVSGIGIIVDTLGKIIEKLDKDIGKKLYFMEKRQERIELKYDEIISLLKDILNKK